MSEGTAPEPTTNRPPSGFPGPRRPLVGRADLPARPVTSRRGTEAGRAEPLHVEARPVPPESDLAPASPPASGSEAVPARALGDLARAFQANAEALQGIHALQSDLAMALKRSDRAEMMVQSTQALNDTFRNLASIQRELLGRLQSPPPAPGARLVPLMLIGILVVFVGGIVAVIHVVERMGEDRPDPVLLAAEMETARRRGHDEATVAGERELVRSRKSVEEVEGRLNVIQERSQESERRLEEALSEKRALEADQSSLADEAVRLRGEAQARRAVEDEMRSTTSKLAVLEPRVQQLEADLAAERNEKQRLQRLIAERRLGIDTEPPAPAPEAAEPKPPAGLERPRSPAVSRDPRQLDAIRSTMNRFLEAGGHKKSEYWQLTRVEAVSADRLHDVTATRYDSRGKLLDAVEAKEVVVWVDRARRVVEFEFRDGGRVFDRQRTPFSGGGLQQVVAEGDDNVRLWLGSGLLMLRTR